MPVDFSATGGVCLRVLGGGTCSHKGSKTPRLFADRSSSHAERRIDRLFARVEASLLRASLPEPPRRRLHRAALHAAAAHESSGTEDSPPPTPPLPRSAHGGPFAGRSSRGGGVSKARAVRRTRAARRRRAEEEGRLCQEGPGTRSSWGWRLCRELELAWQISWTVEIFLYHGDWWHGSDWQALDHASSPDEVLRDLDN